MDATALARASAVVIVTLLVARPAEAQETTPLPGPLVVDPATQPPSPPVKATGPTFEEQVVERVNEERWANGRLPPLKGAALLDGSSESHSSSMASRNFFAHCDVDTKLDPFDRIRAAGYSFNLAGENIAAGQSTPASVMTSWMGSSGHRANILHTGFREIGVGYVGQPGDAGNVRLDQNGDCNADSSGHGPFVHYWTQNFGRRDAVFPVVIAREAYSTPTTVVVLYLYGAGWATQMRLRNGTSGMWTEWLPFVTDFTWVLTGGAGTQLVEVELRNAAGTVRRASDTIVLEPAVGGGGDVPIFADGFETGDTRRWSSPSGSSAMAMPLAGVETTAPCAAVPVAVPAPALR